jgi:tetratricopeptide (TPR) repeat protein
MKKSIFVLTIFLFIIISQVYADHNQHLFEEANKIYQQEKFQEAIKKYLEIVDNHFESWQLYYNLGNTYYRTGQFGKAILYYERAFKKNPKNEDIIFNLRLANTKAVDNIKSPPISEIIEAVRNFLSMTAVVWLMIGTYFSLIAIFILRIFVQKNSVRQLSKLILIPLILVLFLATSVFVLKFKAEISIKYAIIMIDKVDVLGEPSEGGTELFSLHEGAKLRIEGYSGDWAKIRLANGDVGWLKKATFEII